MERPRTRISGPVLDAGDALALADFYANLLGWDVVDRAGTSEHGWALVRSPDRSMKIEIQGLTDYRPPVWPNAGNEQQMQIHLDIAFEDLDTAIAWALECGATVAEHQPRPEAHRVMLDPAGHPFCVFKGQV